MGSWYDRYPAYYGSWPSYYSYGSSFMYSPGYVDENQYALMETCLYAAGNGEKPDLDGILGNHDQRFGPEDDQIIYRSNG